MVVVVVVVVVVVAAVVALVLVAVAVVLHYYLSMSEFGGLWKNQDKAACTKIVTVFRVLNYVGHY